jgi:hypothetical protein
VSVSCCYLQHWILIFGSYGFVCGGGVNCGHVRVEVVSNYLWYSPLRADGIMLKEILFRIATFYH